MRVTTDKYTLELKTWSGLEEMLGRLQHCDGGNIVLGRDAPQHMAFYSIAVKLMPSQSCTLGIGICDEGHGVTPQLLLVAARGRLFIGFNEKVACVNVLDGTMIFEVRLDWLFRELVYIERRRLVLVIYEIGLLALDEGGREIWNYPTDVIESYACDDARIVVHLFDGTTVNIRTEDGRPA